MNPRFEHPEKKAPAKKVRLSRARQVAILKALADPRRYELLERIAKAGCPLGCSQALAALPISAATLSHHVKELENSGLVHIEHEGKYIYLTFNTAIWTAFVASLGAVAKTDCMNR